MTNPRLHLLLPPHEIEEGAWKQIEGALAFPFVKKLAIMPDVHQGYDLPIGSAALLDGYIWPAAIGYDIGCGMVHFNTYMRPEAFSPLSEVYERILESIPVGFNSHEEKPLDVLPPPFDFMSKEAIEQSKYYWERQSGTLGGGNHFIELGVNEEGEVGITIHSGSRRVGHIVGEEFMKLTNGPVPIDSDIGKAYYDIHLFLLSYARRNRELMLLKVLDVLGIINRFHFNQCTSIHNYAEKWTNGILHRKGAISASLGEPCIIPANMGEGVTIAVGLGNDTSLHSASHGAGRCMSRSRAKKIVDVVKAKAAMGGIVCAPVEEVLDEVPEAYKDFNQVLAYQEGINIVAIEHFKPILVVKG